MNKKICFVVHRYAPYSGGSESNVKNMAEAAHSLGVDVTVFTGAHKGNLNGITVTSDPNVLLQKWDLIVVHGGDVGIQDFVLQNIPHLNSPVLFLLILPSNSQTYMNALKTCSYVGCGTIEDFEFVKNLGIDNKIVHIPYGLSINESIGVPGFKEKYNISTSKMVLSSGGYFHNKNHQQLADIFNALKIPDVTLVLTGYEDRSNIMPKSTNYVKSFILENRTDMLSALCESNLFIMNSTSEGFGLVLLEATINKIPWAAKNIAGAKILKNYGFTYDRIEDLVTYITNFNFDSSKRITEQEHLNVLQEFDIKNTIKHIVRLA